MNEWNKLYESVPPLDTPVWAGWFNADGICAYYQAQAVNQNKPHDRKEYTVQIK